MSGVVRKELKQQQFVGAVSQSPLTFLQCLPLCSGLQVKETHSNYSCREILTSGVCVLKVWFVFLHVVRKELKQQQYFGAVSQSPLKFLQCLPLCSGLQVKETHTN